MNPVARLESDARHTPDTVAVYRGAADWASFGRLARRVAGLAAALRGPMALAAGDRVAIVMRNAPEYLEAMYAAWWAGLAAVPVNAKLHPREVAYILEHSGARAAFANDDWQAGLAAAAIPVIAAGSREFDHLAETPPLARVEAKADALAWLFYTSGTTGRPKGAMLSHANLAAMTDAYFASVDDVSRQGRLLHAAPLSHGSGLYTFTHLARGAAQVVPESGGFDAAEVLELLERHANVSMFAAPTMVRRLVDAAVASGARARGLQTLVYGGGPMYSADIEAAMRTFGNRFAQIYGQGESPMTITALTKACHGDRAQPRYAQRLASVGVAQSGVEIAIRDAAGRDLLAGDVGEICVRGDAVMSGYWNDPEATAQALRRGQGQEPNDIWLWTGDLGCLDADGFLTLKDRSKDVIVSGGSNIYPREVEEVLLTHPAVAEAAVVGRPDPEWGEVVVAFVVARGAPPAREELDRLCLDRIARFKRPKDYRYVDALPKNHYGKVLKTELRKLAAP